MAENWLLWLFHIIHPHQWWFPLKEDDLPVWAAVLERWPLVTADSSQSETTGWLHNGSWEPPSLPPTMAAAVATKFSHKLFEPAPMNITETNHCLVIFEKLKIQREQGRFCDVSLKVHGREFPAHRLETLLLLC